MLIFPNAEQIADPFRLQFLINYFPLMRLVHNKPYYNYVLYLNIIISTPQSSLLSMRIRFQGIDHTQDIML